MYRTTDGGKTWERVLFVDENTGCSDIAMDPTNPRILYAGMWPMLIKTWGKWSGGPGGSLHVSRDGGTTWTRLKGSGLPDTEIGKVGLAVAPSSPNRVYALIETAAEGLWRSDDGGESWTQVNRDHALLNRPLYYTRVVVSPNDADEVYFPATRFHMSQDGGKTIQRFSPWGGDHHDMWIDPVNPGRMIVGNDQGIAISTNRGKSWRGIELPVAQMYHVYVDNQVPYYVYGNRQDGTSYRGPSNSRTGGTIPRGLWHPVGGFESGVAVPDPVDNNIVWSGNYDGMLDRFDLRTKQSRAVTVWPESLEGWEPAAVKYRFQWTFPICISPHDHNRVYVGSQFVHMTTNGGQSWEIISPDLSTNDKTKQQRTGGITPDDASPLYGCTLFAIAESPLENGQIWAGTNDGLLHVTRDRGKTWTNVTKNIPGLPEWGTISNIEPSRHSAGTVYITVDLHQVNDRDPYVYKTTDYGKTWKNISAGIPKTPLSYAHCVREDPTRPGLALPRRRERALRVVRRRRELDAAPGQPPARAGPLARRPGALQGPRGRHLRPGILDLRRPDAAPAVDAGGGEGGRPLVQAEAGLPLPARGRARRRAERQHDRQEPALRRVDQLLPERGAQGGSRRHHPRRAGEDGADAEDGGEEGRRRGRRGRRPRGGAVQGPQEGGNQQDLVGPPLRQDRRGQALDACGGSRARERRAEGMADVSAGARAGAGRWWSRADTR